ncbi:MAG: indolepyruvate oxidoreductase subunit beta [Verrucomicrobiota bacterium]|jgi:indolepyruvate ferredoxin oxidoreductase beta subunit
MNNAANAEKRESPAGPPCNIVVAGLGGQGVLTAADIIAEVALRAGYDVKKSEIKGMSQRGGSVACDVRFGAQIHSPMVPVGEADYLLVLEATQVEPNRHVLRSGGVTIEPSLVDADKLPQKKALNVALLGALSAHLSMTEQQWLDAVGSAFAPKFLEANRQAFMLGRASRNKSGERQRATVGGKRA